MTTKPDPWKCKTCGHSYVVTRLARDCEKRHEKGQTA